MATMTNAAAPAKVLSQQKSAFAGNGRALAPARVARAAAARNVAVRAEVKEIHMPALSSTMTEGKIVQWTKQVGDKVSAGDILMVVESDKADMDVESFEDGYIAAILVDDGEVAVEEGLDVHVRLVGLDDDDGVTLADGVALPLEPGDDLALGHGGGERGHVDLLHLRLSGDGSRGAHGLGAVERLARAREGGARGREGRGLRDGRHDDDRCV